jgi:hypothetical protein
LVLGRVTARGDAAARYGIDAVFCAGLVEQDFVE